jgi:Fic family protein
LKIYDKDSIQELGERLEDFYPCEYLERFSNFGEFVQQARLDFGLTIRLARLVARDVWEVCQEVFSYSQKMEVKTIMRKDITKREQAVQVSRVTTKPFSIADFVSTTGMNPNTARRELGAGVKAGLFKRVSRGVYTRV